MQISLWVQNTLVALGVIIGGVDNIFGGPRPYTPDEQRRHHQALYHKINPVFAVLGNCGNPCVVRRNDGGDARIFLAAAQKLSRERVPLVIDGPCISACVLLADVARTFTCTTPRATFFVHKGRRESGELVNPPHSPDIDRWVKSKGDYPIDGFLTIEKEVANRIWARCT